MLYDILSILDEEKMTVLFLREQEGGKFIFPQQDYACDALASEIVGRARATDHHSSSHSRMMCVMFLQVR